MGQVFGRIDAALSEWLLQQSVYFVGTAPLHADGHVNVSPKGMAGTFAVLDEHSVAYLDYFGSGIETAAHLRENGRIVIMMCAFSGPPRIVRLHGRGRYVLPEEPAFGDLRSRFAKERELGQRGVVLVQVERVSDSCGFSVPQLEHVADRDILDRSHSRRDEQYFADYGRNRNAVSIDGLPGLP